MTSKRSEGNDSEKYIKKTFTLYIMKKKTFPNEVYIMAETDTLNFVTKSSTRAHRLKFMIGDIFINAAVCLKCKDYIRSLHVHDFKWCKCSNVAVDGGSHYVKRSFKTKQYIDVIEMFHDISK